MARDRIKKEISGYTQNLLKLTGALRTQVEALQAAGVSTHPDADFSEAYAAADAVLHELSIDYTVTEAEDPAFIGGRRGDIVVAGKTAGVFGEIHPAVLVAFELEHPVAASSSTSEPYRDTPSFKILLYLFYRELTVVEDACRKAGIGFSGGKSLIEMLNGGPSAGRRSA